MDHHPFPKLTWPDLRAIKYVKRLHWVQQLLQPVRLAMSVFFTNKYSNNSLGMMFTQFSHQPNPCSFYICWSQLLIYECLCQANRSKDVFCKHVESVLSKSAKIRSLVGDLQRNYPTDPTARKFLSFKHVQEILCSFLVVKKQLITVNQHPRFHSSPTAHLSIRAVATLNGDLNTLDSEYNTLSNHMAEGERDSFDKPCLNGIVW